MIPKTLHRIWLGPSAIPEEFERYWAKFQTLLPKGWTFRTWTSEDRYGWLVNRDLFEAATTWTSKSDILRFELLARYGGIYVDVDIEPIRSLEPLVSERAFTGWESADSLCGAVVGAEPEHPAILALLGVLPSWTTGRPSAGPPDYAGPGFLTAQWRGREDVRLFAPPTFYPRHWNDAGAMKLYPKETFTDHHWAKSWNPVVEPKLSIVVPWEDRGDKWRSKVAAWTERYWRERFPDAEYLLGGGGGEGPFNRSASINAGAARATGDVLFIVDADGVISSDVVTDAVRKVADDRIWVNPFRDVYRLRREATTKLLRADPATFVPEVPERTAYEGIERRLSISFGGFAVVVSRKGFESVGGFDEDFRGWGSEDIAFMCALDTFWGPHWSPPNPALHFWHTRPEGQRSSPENLRLEGKYRAARGNPDAMATLVHRVPPKRVAAPPPKLPEGWKSSAAERTVTSGRRRPRKEPPMIRNRPPPPPPVDPERVSVLIPFRPERENDTRTRAFEWLLERWPYLLPGAEIVVGTDPADAAFSKTVAVNDAYQHATRDVFVVADADAWMEADGLLDAAARAVESGKLYIPWSKIVRYGKADSDALLGQNPARPLWVPAHAKRRAYPSPSQVTAGTLFVIRRSSFEYVGGMDPRFRGWGYEDVCFSAACFSLVGRRGLPYEGYSLFHDRPHRNGGRVWEDDPGIEYNRALLNRYTRAGRSRKAMLDLAGEHPLGGEAKLFTPPPPKKKRGERIRV